MKILLTNDDGVYAEGIRILASVLIKEGHRLLISAPDRERSAAGHSITILEPLRAKKTNLFNEIDAYKINGTPADCVKLGLEKLIDFKPDLLISGINNGSNMGYDVLYSGTVSAAIEGWMMGFDSIAVSLAHKDKGNYMTAANFINKLILENNFKEFKENILFNINVPDLNWNAIRGVKVNRLGTSLYKDNYEERLDPNGEKYYWLSGGNGREVETETDIWAVKNNYISITPLKIELNNKSLVEKWTPNNKLSFRSER